MGPCPSRPELTGLARRPREDLRRDARRPRSRGHARHALSDGPPRARDGRKPRSRAAAERSPLSCDVRRLAGGRVEAARGRLVRRATRQIPRPRCAGAWSGLRSPPRARRDEARPCGIRRRRARRNVRVAAHREHQASQRTRVRHRHRHRHGEEQLLGNRQAKRPISVSERDPASHRRCVRGRRLRLGRPLVSLRHHALRIPPRAVRCGLQALRRTSPVGDHEPRSRWRESCSMAR